MVRDGGIVIGRTTPHIPHANISSFEGMLPKNANWRTAGVNEGEDRRCLAKNASLKLASLKKSQGRIL